ncbi:MAG: ATP-binding cassette domain-containing protein [Planctomycetes bacterium]|nr:ATP-binding cassette domain-containing protein [Planctomycetota bacterium]
MIATPAQLGPDVEFVGVHKRIGDRVLLHDLTLSIPRGERVALIGPSGAGKTTLLRLCGGVTWPTTGEVRVLGQRTGALHGRALCRLRKQIGFLHQHDNLVPGLRVAHNVLIGRLGQWSLWKALWSLLRPQEVDRAAGALQRVELASRLWALPEELSGGEQQRVAIARLLLQSPRLVLADEPASSLDIRLGREIVQQLLALAGKDTTVLVSLHALDLLQLPFDRVLALRDGAVVFDGPVKSITRDLLRAVYGEEYQRLHLDDVDLVRNGGA